MREDVVELLDKLKLTDFRYREFSDSFADMELWPIFEAILSDPNVVGKPHSLLMERAVNEQQPVPQPPEPSVVPVAGRSDTAAGLFSAYGTPPRESGTRPRGDLRAFLRRLSAEHTGGIT